ncbi:SMI1/KNR4 family protein [Pseudomonas juntendi]|uniref:SMI1/KNR4 family protein n=1 Tax=Pseudomonas TaxID=286 RepID=UPI000811886C|nr:MULTISPECIES: SMI1/KNR4 family protein [Pseudomonas]EKT4452722.1 SMI1/KNR4 family protein [Pseudomonas putida]MBH3385827.1 SMI1/KNR4 family protein [Pseudomonas juntendi]
MKTLENLVNKHQANTRPADPDSIIALQQDLGFMLSPEYKSFLSTFGVIVFDAYETYGLGIPKEYYLHVFTSYKDLSKDPNYPTQAVPLLDIGDGQYYLYDNQSKKVLVWATPNGGVVRVLDDSLESFLIHHVFAE